MIEALILAFAASGDGNSAFADTDYKRWRFTKDQPGTAAQHVKVERGAWVVAKDGENNVLSCREPGAVALVGATYRDVDIHARVTSPPNLAAGIQWRSSAKSPVVGRVVLTADNRAVVSLEESGRTAELLTTAIPAAKKWRSLRMTLRDGIARITVDGLDLPKVALPKEASLAASVGVVAVENKGGPKGETAMFDEISMRTPPPERSPEPADSLPAASPTRKFSIVNDRACLDGIPIKLWGVRWGNALASEALLERHLHCLDDYVAHGVNLVGVYLQGCNAAWPNPDAGHNAFEPDGRFKQRFARRLERFVRACDARGMAVLVGCFSPRHDQELNDEAAVKRGLEEVGRYLTNRQLRNVMVDAMHEFNNPARADLPIFREPDGAGKRAKLAAWFKAAAPSIPFGVCPSEEGNTSDAFPGMTVRIIQKDMPIPATGLAVNVEMQRFDIAENEGVYTKEQHERMREMFRKYADAPNAALMFHSSYTHGVGGRAGTGPNPEIGGWGLAEDDRGSRVYFDWLRRNVGRWELPGHVKY